MRCTPTHPSVRTAQLDASRGFFNGTSLFLRVEGQTDGPTCSKSAPPKGRWAGRWLPDSPLYAVNAQGFGTYLADDYDELVDCPVETGCRSGVGRFKALRHSPPVSWWPVRPLPLMANRLLADTQKDLRDQPSVSGTAPKARRRSNSYVFMLNAVDGRLWRAGAPQLHGPDLRPPRPAPTQERAPGQRGLHNALLGLDQPRVLPHLERQAPAPCRVRPL